MENLSTKEKMVIASSLNTITGVLTKLSSDSDRDVRWRVADNPNTPTSVLITLSGDADWHTQWRVAGNPSTPIDTLTKLASHSNVYVRDAAAKNLKKNYRG